MQGLSLVRWTGEYETHLRGYSALARLCFVRGDWAGALDNVKTLEEIQPEDDLYAQALRYRFLVCDSAVNKAGLDEARRLAAHNAVQFRGLPDITGWNFMLGPIFGFAISGHSTYALFKVEISGPNLWTGGAFVGQRRVCWR